VEEENLLLIFTRNPELGKCKTRLAAKLGDQTALDIYQFLLQHTANLTRKVNAKKQVYYSEAIWHNDIWDPAVYEKKLQEGHDLGERMAAAFELGFECGYQKIIVIGSDMYDLSAEDLENAFAALDTHNYVVGPAEDGGYYFLGMTTHTPSLFQNKAWGTETVFDDSMQNLTDQKIKIFPIKNDVDVYEDIKDISAFQPFLNRSKQ